MRDKLPNGRLTKIAGESKLLIADNLGYTLRAIRWTTFEIPAIPGNRASRGDEWPEPNTIMTLATPTCTHTSTLCNHFENTSERNLAQGERQNR